MVDEEASERIDMALREWRQGDCALCEHWLLFRSKVNAPLTDEAAEAASEVSGFRRGRGSWLLRSARWLSGFIQKMSYSLQ